MDDLEARIAQLEKRAVSLKRRVQIQTAVIVVGIALLIGGYSIASGKPKHFDSITAKDLSVVDDNGTVRARLGGDLPDAVMFGGRVSKRGGKAAGLIIYDEDGIERGGYVTQMPGSNAMLTLDSKYRQAALFVAGPDESQASALQLWTKGSAIELRSDDNGSRLTASTDKKTSLQLPQISISTETCAELREVEEKYPDAGACRSRFTEQACRVCLKK